MLLTIWNLTGHPILGYLPQKATTWDRFNVRNLRKQKPSTVKPSSFLVQPFIDFSTTLPKSCSKTITLLPDGDSASTQAEIASGPEGGIDNRVNSGFQVR